MSHSAGFIAHPSPAVRAKLTLRAELRGLLAAGLKAIFFPIVELADGMIVGHEGLTRFADGSSPQLRFEQARDVGMSLALETAAIEGAIANAEQLPISSWLSLNVSPRLLLSPPDSLITALQAAPRPLVLELVEYEVVADYEALRQAQRQLAMQLPTAPGWALDDIGASFAGLAHLLELPATYIKLDRSLINNLEVDQRRQALVRALAVFGEQVQSTLIAEGVETEEQRQLLLRLGVRLGQGYLFWRPPPN